MKQLKAFSDICIRCWQYAYPMYRLLLVNIDVDRSDPRQEYASICTSCLEAMRKRRDEAPYLDAEDEQAHVHGAATWRGQ
jgi:hypothetical protein